MLCAAETERIAMGFTPTEFLEWFLNDLRLSPRAGRMGRRLWNAYGRLDFRELDVPFAALALDLGDGGPAVLTAGNVGRAVEASIRVPLIIRPVRHEGRHLIDGGLHSTVPVAAARDLGAELVVAVNVGELFALPRRLRSLSARASAALEARPATPDSLRNQVGFLARRAPRRRDPAGPARRHPGLALAHPEGAPPGRGPRPPGPAGDPPSAGRPLPL